MISSKNLFIFLALLFALAAIPPSSQVSASEEIMKTNAVEEVKYAGPGYGGGYGGRGGGGYPGRRWRYGCCRGYRYGPGCKRCCGSAHEAPDAEFEDDVKN
ncbi:hypothetical protein M9H77_31044 [Catharanthus roseus]|uniref:Uncharacterized protein n=1 Tax=Catharanthus roseus TaxID=4058 RepID=A0ACC0A088_CATRO|nr:hypothetical protein M9H77_31044 [Catharanthus roseus]